MEWWQALQETDPLKNELQLSSECLEKLAEDMNRYVELDEDLPAQLMHFVVDGENETVLPLLAGSTKELSYENYRYNSAFLDHQWSTDPGFYARLLQVYCSEPIQWGINIQNPLDPEEWIREILNILGQRVNHQQEVYAFSAFLLDELFIYAGCDPGSFISYVYSQDPHQGWTRLTNIAKQLNDFSSLSSQHSDKIIQVLITGNTYQKIHVLSILEAIDIPLDPFLDPVLDLSVASVKTLRESAQKLLRKDPPLFLDLLKERVKISKISERYYLPQIIWELEGKESIPYLEDWLANEQAAKVQSALEQVLLGSHLTPEEAPDLLQLPEPPEIKLNDPLHPEIIPLLENLINTCNQAAPKLLEKLVDRILKDRNSGRLHYQWQWDLRRYLEEITVEKLVTMFASAQVSETDLKEAFYTELGPFTQPHSVSYIVRIVQEGSFEDCIKLLDSIHFSEERIFQKELNQILDHPHITLIQTLRLLAVFSSNYYHSFYNSSWIGNPNIVKFFRCHSQAQGLRELEQTLIVWAKDTSTSPQAFLHSRYLIDQVLSFWSDDQIWPYFAENLSDIEKAIEDGDYENVLRILALFPTPPPTLVNSLWKIALGSRATHRRMAQSVLNKLPDIIDRVVKLLQDNRAEIRGIAAEWIIDLQASAAVIPLKTILKKEKNDPAKDKMLRALSKLGASVEEFLDRKNLVKEAEQGLRKEIPVDLQWFPFTALPSMHWADTREQVDPNVLKWFILQSYKQKKVEPGPILRRYVDQFDRKDRENLGQFILESWMTQDTLPRYTPQEADALAQQRAPQEYTYYQQQIQHLQTFLQSPQLPPLLSQSMSPQQVQQWQQQQMQMTQQQLQEFQKITPEQLYRNYYSSILRECKGSAVSEKGILALAACCCGAAAVPLIENYLKTWFGNRAAQCKALLEVLSWIEDYSAVQLLLSVASRFRTKGIQKDAELRVNQLAERKGWSLEELADRTIPTAGLDPSGQVILDYGERQFQVQLQDGLELNMIDPSGKVIKSLPNPRKSEDPELVKAAKKQLSETRKQLKQVLQLQKERLYEAMCTQRSWPFLDWVNFLFKHPIVGHYCQRLIWAAYQEDQLLCLFRPLEDGSLTDVEDNPLTVDPSTMIKLAHTCTVSPEDTIAWREHLSDYEVDPLFPQFGPRTPDLVTDEHADETEIKSFEGYILEAFQLRGVLTKLGYSRATSEDGGYFYAYKKSFSGLGIEAVINFTGNYLPEENRTVALTTLFFQRIMERESYFNPPQLPLKAVPPVLLQEVWNDMQRAAAQGSGYDPEWQSKVDY
jgi:hypothetical protein